MNRDFIIVHLWPKTTWFAGKRVHRLDDLGNITPEILAVTPSDAELLIAEYQRSPDSHKQQVAQSVEAALREWREAISDEDVEKVPAPYAGHVEQRIEEAIQEEQPYG